MKCLLLFSRIAKMRNYQQFNNKRMMSGSGSNPLTITHLNNGVRTITMSDHKTRNALSIAMMTNLIENIKHDENNANVRAIVITSADGAPIFSAGHNLKELQNGRHIQEKVFNLAASLMTALIDSPVPIIARVDGLAAAAGCQLIAQCDLAVCTARSTFSTPGVNFGIFCSTPGVALARCVPKATAMRMLLTGAAINSAEAEVAGLVTAVCQGHEDFDRCIDEYCEAIRGKSRDVIELGKKFYYKQIDTDVRTAYRLGANVMVDNLQLEDGKEGVRSFVEKRKPIWKT